MCSLTAPGERARRHRPDREREPKGKQRYGAGARAAGHGGGQLRDRQVAKGQEGREESHQVRRRGVLSEAREVSRSSQHCAVSRASTPQCDPVSPIQCTRRMRSESAEGKGRDEEDEESEGDSGRASECMPKPSGEDWLPEGSERDHREPELQKFNLFRSGKD